MTPHLISDLRRITSQIKQMLKSMDTDGDGAIDALEMVRVMKKMMEDERKIKSLKRVVLIVVLVALAFVGVRTKMLMHASA